MKGILTLIDSINPPVFETPLEIEYWRSPEVGESFLFQAMRYGSCNTSEVKKIGLENGLTFLSTRNSIYKLEETK